MTTRIKCAANRTGCSPVVSSLSSRFKPLKLFVHLLILATGGILLGCSSENKIAEQPDAPDGFYVVSTNKATGYRLKVFVPGEREERVIQLQEFKGIVPRRIRVFDGPDGYYVQVNCDGAAKNWSEEGIFVVVRRKAYLELTKSGQAVSESGDRIGSPAMISLVLPTQSEAETVASALRTRYSLPSL